MGVLTSILAGVIIAVVVVYYAAYGISYLGTKMLIRRGERKPPIMWQNPPD